MMKYLKTLSVGLLFFLPLFGFGQYYLNINKRDILNTVKEYKPDIGVTPEGNYCISWVEDDVMMMVWFDDDEISNQMAIITRTDVLKNIWIRVFNTKCVKVNDVEWRSYLEGRVFKIYLKYLKGTYGFIITDITND